MTTALVETQIRRIQREDRERIRTLLAETGVFKPEEIDVAMELVDIALGNPSQKDYEMHVATNGAGEVVGYLCFGHTPITEGTFDLYWIAVKPEEQEQGIGRQLLRFAEGQVRSRGGRLFVAETSSQQKYMNVRTFYLHNGYLEVAHIRDYYQTGDDLLIYAKYLRD